MNLSFEPNQLKTKDHQYAAILFSEFLKWIQSQANKHGAEYKRIISSLSLQDLYNFVVTPDSFVPEINNIAKCWVKEAASECRGQCQQRPAILRRLPEG